jgi:hypothetical protein
VVALVLLAAAPAGASAFSKAIWGDVFRNGVNQFPIYKTLGVSIYQAKLVWSDVAPTRPADPTNPKDPAYRWPRSIQWAVWDAKRFHMRVLLQVIYTPAWANGGRARNWAPTHVSDYAAFITAATRRYPTVHLWMIWGEPSRRPNFEPLSTVPPGVSLTPAQQRGPHIYARMLDAAYVALKRASTKNVVIGGCTYTTGDIDTQEWIENLRLPNGRPPRMDMYAHNPFGDTVSFSAPASPFDEVEFSDLPELAGWIDQYLHRGLPIFVSEWTIPTAPDDEFNFWVAPRYAAQDIRVALRESRRWRRMYAVGWVNVYDDPPRTAGGLLTVSGRPKPGFWAFARG